MVLIGKLSSADCPWRNAEQLVSTCQVAVIGSKCKQRLLGSQTIALLSCSMGITAVSLSERSQMAEQSAFFFYKADISRSNAGTAKSNDDLGGTFTVLGTRHHIAAILLLLSGQPCNRLVECCLYCCLAGM
ncbi:hypothetical protein D3C76_1390740 [compost metagenome]